MDSSALSKHIIQYIYTKKEADELLEKLSDYLNSKFSFTESANIFASLRPELAQILNNTFTKDLSIEQTKQLIEELNHKLNYPVIRITLSYIPQGKGLERIAAKARQMYGECLLEISYDNSIIGGAVIIAGGKYQDYTLKNKLKTIFEKHPEEIAKLL